MAQRKSTGHQRGYTRAGGGVLLSDLLAFIKNSVHVRILRCSDLAGLTKVLRAEEPAQGRHWRCSHREILWLSL